MGMGLWGDSMDLEVGGFFAGFCVCRAGWNFKRGCRLAFWIL